MFNSGNTTILTQFFSPPISLAFHMVLLRSTSKLHVQPTDFTPCQYQDTCLNHKVRCYMIFSIHHLTPLTSKYSHEQFGRFMFFLHSKSPFFSFSLSYIHTHHAQETDRQSDVLYSLTFSVLESR